MGLFKRKRKNVSQPVDEKQLKEAFKRELGSYINRDDLKEYIDKINKDEEKKRLWDSLSSRKKIKLLRHLVGKKGENDGKK